MKIEYAALAPAQAYVGPAYVGPAYVGRARFGARPKYWILNFLRPYQSHMWQLLLWNHEKPHQPMSMFLASPILVIAGLKQLSAA